MSTALEQSPAGGQLPVMDRGVLPTTEVVARVHRIQEVMKALMKEGVHYGKIPGTPKETLYKPGAELLLMTFRIAASPSLIEDLSTPDEVRYRVTVRGTNQTTGEILGEMSGECSSNEMKYRWRAPVCNEEFDETDPSMRREVWKKGNNKDSAYKQKQIRTSPADVANTILKMAMKRALIAMCLAVLACSDIFAQDLEDLAEELRESLGNDTPAATTKDTREPQRASQTGNGGQKAQQQARQQNGPPQGDGVVIGTISKMYTDKDPASVYIKGDERRFGIWKENFGHVIEAAKQLSSARATVALTFVKKGDYFNAIDIRIHDAVGQQPAQQQQAPQQQPAEPVDPRDYDPFNGGGREREPGEDD